MATASLVIAAAAAAATGAGLYVDLTAAAPAQLDQPALAM